MSLNLAGLLKVGTQNAHREAERVQFIRQFLAGKVPKEIYKIFIASLYFIYQALEEETHRNCGHELFKSIHFPKELNRCGALELDLEFYFGSNYKVEIKRYESSIPLQNYIQRIHHVGQHEPELLVAHTYTRYLGDLSGGQILKKATARAYGLRNGMGTRFYDFEAISDHKKFKDMYRQLLNDLPVDFELASRIVDEANSAFIYNTELFKELDTLLPSSEIPRTMLLVPQSSKQSTKCPFAKLTNILPAADNATLTKGIVIGIILMIVWSVFW
jgi:heme oxygenase